jgi:autotransporter-associated beta strand protein
MPSPTLSRRTLLRAAVAASAGPALLPALGSAPAVAAGTTAFVTDYQTNVTANTTADTNAAVRILSGMQRLWHTGTAWNTGSPLDAAVLRANVRYCVKTTTTRTAAQAARAFIQDRQHQSYAAISGLGPLAGVYKAGALAVTSITSAPATTPPTTIDDAVPAGAPAGSAIGAGSPTSALGQVVNLVNTVRGNYSSGNPSKNAYQYPRPWRMNADSQVVDTGVLDEFGFPVYDSEVKVVPQLLRQRSLTPASDGGFPSGHTNAFHLAALAFAYAVPERFQELVTAAFDLAETRIVAGMHSPVDVLGGRVLATALAAAILGDPANAQLKADARAQALAYFTAQVGADLFAYAHNGQDDAYANRAANERIVNPKLTYGLPAARACTPMTVPQGAEVLLETRQPYLTAAQRREVLRTTAVDAGHPLLDGPENWGRLNLFAAADGYGAFDADVTVTLDAAQVGFAAADSWRNDITGRGGLVKAGTGTLTLTGANSYRGGTTVTGGTLVAGSGEALGLGPVTVTGGTLRVPGGTRVHGAYQQRTGTLALGSAECALQVDGEAVLGAGSVLEVDGVPGRDLTVLRARQVRGQFAKVVAANPAYRAGVSYTRTTVTVRLRKA